MFLEVWISQEEGGVVGGHEFGAVVRVKTSPEGGYFFFGLQEGLGREGPQGANNFGPNGLQLFEEKGEAGLNLIGSGIAVVRGAAFHDVGDVYLLPRQVDGLNDAGEKFPGPANKGLALEVLVSARPFSNKDEAGVGVSFAEDQVVSSLMEPAPGALSYFPSYYIEIQYGSFFLLRKEGIDPQFLLIAQMPLYLADDLP